MSAVEVLLHELFDCAQRAGNCDFGLFNLVNDVLWVIKVFLHILWKFVPNACLRRNLNSFQWLSIHVHIKQNLDPHSSQLIWETAIFNNNLYSVETVHLLQFVYRVTIPAETQFCRKVNNIEEITVLLNVQILEALYRHPVRLIRPRIMNLHIDGDDLIFVRNFDGHHQKVTDLLVFKHDFDNVILIVENRLPVAGTYGLKEMFELHISLLCYT